MKKLDIGSSYIPENNCWILRCRYGCSRSGQESDERAVTICAMDSSTPYDLGMRNKLRKIAEEKILTIELIFIHITDQMHLLLLVQDMIYVVH